jgi:Fe/S biogenesis protein NfuA
MSSENILVITEAAREKIIEIRDQEPEGADSALLIEITGVRGMQFAYELSFVPMRDRPEAHRDHHGDLVVVVPEDDVPNLSGASLDMTPQGLAMDNPNSPTPAFGGEPIGELTGPIADQVSQVLDRSINPAIAGHGGAAELVGVEGNDVYLRLLGGCQGCGLAAVTLRQGIERMLRSAIPDLGQIVDVTDHQAGTNPYYESAKK